jgi:hypothetical protein
MKPSALILVCLSLCACSTAKKVNAVLDNANTTAQNINTLAKNFNETLNQLKAQAKEATKAAPAASAQVPPIPPKQTGNVDITKPVDAKTGTGTADMDGNGSTEQVTVTVADQSTVSSQSIRPLDFKEDDATEFLAWKGTEAGGDQGTCYLAWEHEDKMWIEIAACGANTAHVWSDDGSTIACSACNESGACATCDDNKALDECAAPAGG